MATSLKFTDLDLNFIPNPATGDVSVKNDENAVKQSIKNLVMTLNTERPFQPQIGSQVSRLMFEPMTVSTQIMLKNAIADTITNFEPRAKLQNVDVIFDDNNNDVRISITFVVLNTSKPVFLDIFLKRTR